MVNFQCGAHTSASLGSVADEGVVAHQFIKTSGLQLTVLGHGGSKLFRRQLVSQLPPASHGIGVANTDRLAAVASRSALINRTGEFDAQREGHRKKALREGARGKT